MSISTWISAGVLAVGFVLPAWANDLSAPTGRVLLEVSGDIGNANVDDVAQFDMAMLRGLDWREVDTYTSFTTGMQSFAGPTLFSLLAAVEANGERLNATAINDYFVEIPVEHAQAHDVILAVEMNGKQMRLRDKGPIWVVYPLSEKEAATKKFDTEMIWQMNRIEVLN